MAENSIDKAAAADPAGGSPPENPLKGLLVEMGSEIDVARHVLAVLCVHALSREQWEDLRDTLLACEGVPPEDREMAQEMGRRLVEAVEKIREAGEEE